MHLLMKSFLKEVDRFWAEYNDLNIFGFVRLEINWKIVSHICLEASQFSFTTTFIHFICYNRDITIKFRELKIMYSYQVVITIS